MKYYPTIEEIMKQYLKNFPKPKPTNLEKKEKESMKRKEELKEKGLDPGYGSWKPIK